jgi:hypothetical protein
MNKNMLSGVMNIATGKTEYLDLNSEEGSRRFNQILRDNIAKIAADVEHGDDEALKQKARQILAEANELVPQVPNYAQELRTSPEQEEMHKELLRAELALSTWRLEAQRRIIQDMRSEGHTDEEIGARLAKLTVKTITATDGTLRFYLDEE